MEYKVSLKKLNNTGSDYDTVKLSIVEQQELSDLIEKYYERDNKS